MAALFGHVWDTGDLGRNMRGGSGLLPDALGRDLGTIVRTGTRVTSVEPQGAGVRVRFEGPDGAGEIDARTAIVAVPAPHVPALLGDAITPELADALALVRFGPMVVLSILTDEAEPMPWDDLYSVLTPDARFNMFFNHANALNGTGAPKRGSVLMVYGGGGRARALAGKTEDEIRAAFLEDLDHLFPQVRRHIAETWVQSWEHAGPFAGARSLARSGGPRAGPRRPHLPGRRRHQRVRLDGDRGAHRGRRGGRGQAGGRLTVYDSHFSLGCWSMNVVAMSMRRANQTSPRPCA